MELLKLTEILVCRQTEQKCQAYGGQIICCFFEMVIFSNEQIATVFRVSGGNCCFTVVMNHLGRGGFRYVGHVCCCTDFISLPQMLPAFLGGFRKRLLAGDTLLLSTCQWAHSPFTSSRRKCPPKRMISRRVAHPWENKKINFFWTAADCWS